MYGNSKICLISSQIPNWLSKSESLFICTRFIGTTPNSTTIYQVICSIVRQIHLFDNMPMPRSFYKLKEKFKYFITHVPDEHVIVLILDAVDQLDSLHNALNFNWLPLYLPKNVKIILTATLHPALQTKLHWLIDQENHFLEIEPFHPRDNFKLFQTLMGVHKRTLIQAQ